MPSGQGGQLLQTQIGPLCALVDSVQPLGQAGAWQMGGAMVLQTPLGTSQEVKAPGQSALVVHWQLPLSQER